MELLLEGKNRLPGRGGFLAKAAPFVGDLFLKNGSIEQRKKTGGSSEVSLIVV